MSGYIVLNSFKYLMETETKGNTSSGVGSHSEQEQKVPSSLCANAKYNLQIL